MLQRFTLEPIKKIASNAVSIALYSFPRITTRQKITSWKQKKKKQKTKKKKKQKKNERREKKKKMNQSCINFEK